MLNEPDDAARNNAEASKQYRLAGLPGDAIRSLHKAADYWYAKGSVSRAALARGALGEWLATNGIEQSAMEEFVAAAEYYLEDQKPAYVFCYSSPPPGYNPSIYGQGRTNRQTERLTRHVHSKNTGLPRDGASKPPRCAPTLKTSLKPRNGTLLWRTMPSPIPP